MCDPILETKFHTHTKQLAAGGMTKGSEPNGSKHSLNLVCS
jgi:hypothetical protein